ncbi:unnamed protein product [Lampetra planeri]
MAGEVAVPETVGANATPPHEQPEDDWRRETEQLDSLRAVVVQLVSLLTASTVAGRSTHASPGGSHPGPPLQAYMLLDAAIHPYGRQVILFRDGEINA